MLEARARPRQGNVPLNLPLMMLDEDEFAHRVSRCQFVVAGASGRCCTKSGRFACKLTSVGEAATPSVGLAFGTLAIFIKVKEK